MAAADTAEGEQPGTVGQVMPEEEPQAAVIADVATDPDPEGDGTANPVVLELGVGRVDELHAVVPLIEEDGSITLQVARGGVFSYYDFTWPMDDRLTDEKWREMLEQGVAPPRPAWISSFYTHEGEHSALRQGVSSYLESVVSALWYLEPQNLSGGEALQRQLTSEIEALQAENRYQGRTLMGVDFRSFDRQSEDLAVVTVRETWRDALYEGDSPSHGEEPIAQRGPYTLDATYTLERGDFDRWQVTRAVYVDGPPEWQ
jgi:hypothetical protein